MLSWYWEAWKICTGTSEPLSHLAALQIYLFNIYYYYSLWSVCDMSYYTFRGFGRFRMTAAPAWLVVCPSLYWTNIHRKKRGSEMRWLSIEYYRRPFMPSILSNFSTFSTFEGGFSLWVIQVIPWWFTQLSAEIDSLTHSIDIRCVGGMQYYLVVSSS